MSISTRSDSTTTSIPAGALDDLRRELDAKIENKLSVKTFWGVVGLVGSVLAGLFFISYSLYMKIDYSEDRLARIETTIQIRLPQESR